MTQARRVEQIIVGGGLAGSMLGLRLARAGREVVLLERERTAQHKVCGEFLSGEAVDYLRQVELEPMDLGAVEIRRVRLSAGGRTAEAMLPFTALSLSRHVLDEALLGMAAKAGCAVVRGSVVEGLVHENSGWRIEIRASEPWTAATVFLANGKHDLRNFDRMPGPHGDLVGFKLHWRLAPSQTDELRDTMELFLFAGGYGGISLVEGNAANLCLVVRRAHLRTGGGWDALLASILRDTPHLEDRLKGAEALWPRPLAVSSIPYGYLAGRPDGLWCVGDQAAVIPSFTGDGMSIALHSATLAARMFLAGASADKYHRSLATQLSGRMRRSTWLSRAMITDAGRAFAPFALSLFPQSLRWIARSTRIPESAFLQAMR
jgi:flavin-dependent dehydrogenase